MFASQTPTILNALRSPPNLFHDIEFLDLDWLPIVQCECWQIAIASSSLTQNTLKMQFILLCRQSSCPAFTPPITSYASSFLQWRLCAPPNEVWPGCQQPLFICKDWSQWVFQVFCFRCIFGCSHNCYSSSALRKCYLSFVCNILWIYLIYVLEFQKKGFLLAHIIFKLICIQMFSVSDLLLPFTIFFRQLGHMEKLVIKTPPFSLYDLSMHLEFHDSYTVQLLHAPDRNLSSSDWLQNEVSIFQNFNSSRILSSNNFEMNQNGFYTTR